MGRQLRRTRAARALTALSLGTLLIAPSLLFILPRPPADGKQGRAPQGFGCDVLANFRSAAAALGCAAAVAATSIAPDHLGVAYPAYAEVILNAEEKQTVDLFQRNTPGVVFITSQVFGISGALTNARQMEVMAVPKGSGSGWVYDNAGHIVTNYHVIQEAQALIVKFIDGTEVPAAVVGADPYTDVAVLQVDLPKSRRGILTPLRRGESAPLNVGQEVLAIGNPFGLDHTLTRGIVSGVGRTITSVGGRPIQGAIQTDASINPGNSGGPLLNSQGEVIGMNTMILSPSGASSGVGFAIPSDTVAARVNSILKYGYVKRPSLGIYLGQDGLARRLAGRDGGYVAGLQETSAAGQAGIRSGDIITQIQDRRVKKVNDIYAALDEHEPGERISMRLLRPVERSSEEPPVFTERAVVVQLMEAAKDA